MIFKDEKDNKNFYMTLVISFFYILPIIISNRYQVDDVGRSLDGYTGWAKNGRPLADIISSTLSFGTPLPDSSPLGLILGVIILCLCISTYAKENFKAIDNNHRYVFLFLFIANPFLIENLSFKFDVLTMCLSAGLIFLVYSLPKKTIWYIFSVALISASLMLYQASIGLYPILAIISILHFDKCKKNIKAQFSELSIRIIVLFIAYLITHLFTYKYVATHDYSKVHSEIIPLGKDGLEILRNNYLRSISIMDLYFKSTERWIVFSYAILFYILYSLHAFKISKDLARGLTKTALVAFYMTLPVFVFSFSFLHIALLKLPVWNARVFISFGGFLLFVGVITFSVIKSNIVRFVIITPIIYLSFLHVYSFGNASSAQGKNDDVIMSSISYDIKHIRDKKTELSIYGWMPRSKPLEKTIERLPLIRSLVPMFLGTNNFWGGTKLRHYDINLKFMGLTDMDYTVMCREKPSVISDSYSIFMNGEKVIVSFSKPNCKK